MCEIKDIVFIGAPKILINDESTISEEEATCILEKFVHEYSRDKSITDVISTIKQFIKG